jgi:hypothetical protein
MALVRAKARGSVTSRQPGFLPKGPAVWQRLLPGQTAPRHSNTPRGFPEIARRNAAEARQRRNLLAAKAETEASQRPRQPEPDPIQPVGHPAMPDPDPPDWRAEEIEREKRRHRRFFS